MSGDRSSLQFPRVAEEDYGVQAMPVDQFAPGQILADCNNLLHSLATSTEEEFLFIGVRLQDFQERAGRISEIASKMSLLISGDEITSTITDMQHLMKRVSGFTREAEEDLSRVVSLLQQVIMTMDNVLIQNGEMQSIGRVLFRHGLMVAVENATCGHKTQGIRALGDDVKKLSATARDICQRVQEHVNLMNEMINEAIVRIETHRKNQKVRGGRIQDRASETLRWLEDHYRLAASGAASVETASGQIGQCVTNVATHLQFHDITRQDWERLKRDLSAVLSAWQKLPASPDSDLPPRLFAETVLFSDFASEQIRNTSSDFSLAVQIIKENLNKLSAIIRSMMVNIGDLVQQEDQGRQAFLSVAHKNLLWISSSVPELFRHSQVVGQLGDLIEGIGRLCRDMTAHLGEVEEMGDDIHLLSLNAVIQSDAIGTAGRSLEVLADSIQHISKEAREVSHLISGLFQKTITFSEDFAVLVGEVNSRIAGRQAELTSDLRRLPSALEEINSQVGRLLNSLTAEGNFLAARIEEVMERVQVDREAGQYSELLSNHLGKIRYAAEGTGLSLPEKDAFYGRYPVREMMIDPVFHTIRNPREDVTPGEKDEIELF